MGGSRAGWVVAAFCLIAIGGGGYYLLGSHLTSPVQVRVPGSAHAIEARPSVGVAAEKAVEDRFARVLRNSRGAVSAWFGQQGLRVLPQAWGGDEGDTNRVGPIIITKVSGTNDIVWPSHRFVDGDHGVCLTHMTGPAESDLAKKGVVAFEKGRIRINAAAFPEDGKWHLFCLSAEDPLGTSEDEREVFCVLKAAGQIDAGGSTDPAELVARGYVAEGWAVALDAKWSEDQIRCLVFMACGQMDLLAREVQVAVLDGMRDKRHAFLTRDLITATSAFDPRKQALLQNLSKKPRSLSRPSTEGPR